MHFSTLVGNILSSFTLTTTIFHFTALFAVILKVCLNLTQWKSHSSNRSFILEEADYLWLRGGATCGLDKAKSYATRYACH